jgi:hypothetical protein
VYTAERSLHDSIAGRQQKQDMLVSKGAKKRLAEAPFARD